MIKKRIMLFFFFSSTMKGFEANKKKKTGKKMKMMLVFCVAALFVSSAFGYSIPRVTNFKYRQTFVIENVTPSPLSNYDVLFHFPTASLISSGDLSSSCHDLEFVSSSGVFYTKFFESECIRSDLTAVWIRIPSLSAFSSISVYVFSKERVAGYISYYVANWGSKWMSMSTTSCSNGWSKITSLDGKYFYKNRRCRLLVYGVYFVIAAVYQRRW